MTFPQPSILVTCVVLVADDDPDILSLCVELLSASGHTVESAVDGIAALGAAATGRFEAAVLDVDMPGKSGIEVARECRASRATEGIAIVFHTATAQHEVDARFTDYDAFVAKPCFGNELATAVARVVDARRKTIARQP